MRRGVAAATVSLAVAGLVASCGGSDVKAGETEVDVGLDTSALTNFHYWVAETLGYYEDEGLRVKLTPTEGAQAVAQQLVAGNFDIGTGAAEAWLTAMQANEVYPFYSVLKDYRTWVVPNDSSIQSVADLEGTKVATGSLEGGEVPIMRYILTQQGFNVEEDVEIVAVGEEPAGIAAALEAGRVESYGGALSDVVPIEAATGIKLRQIYPESFADLPVEFLTATPAFKDKPEALVGFARATAKANLFCQTNPSACLDVVAEDHPEIVADREAAMGTLEVYLGISKAPTKAGEEYYGEFGLEDWEKYLDIFSSGDSPLLSSPESINLEDYLVLDLTDQINDFDHDAIVKQAEEY